MVYSYSFAGHVRTIVTFFCPLSLASASVSFCPKYLSYLYHFHHVPHQFIHPSFSRSFPLIFPSGFQCIIYCGILLIFICKTCPYRFNFLLSIVFIMFGLIRSYFSFSFQSWYSGRSSPEVLLWRQYFFDFCGLDCLNLCSIQEDTFDQGVEDNSFCHFSFSIIFLLHSIEFSIPIIFLESDTLFSISIVDGPFLF